MIKSGFFNSKNHDRLYYNEDISRLFNSLIIDGVFQNIGGKFIARPGDGMTVVIPSGLAYFNSTWIFNDTDYIQSIDTAPIVAGYTRIDGVFLRMGPEDDTGYRENIIYYMAGQAVSQNVQRPVPVPEYGEVYIPICYVTITTGVTAITASMISNQVGTSTTPFVSGILKTIDAGELLAQWESQWNDWINTRSNDYSEWTTERQAEYDAWIANQENEFITWITNKKTETEEDIQEWISDDQTLWSTWFDSVKEDLATVEVGELKNKVDAIIGIYVVEDTLYMPITAASVSDSILSIGLPY